MHVPPTRFAVIAFLRGSGILALSRCAASAAMDADRASTGPGDCFSLRCSAYEIRNASLGVGYQRRARYKLTCRRLTSADMEGLGNAVTSRTNVVLVFEEGCVELADVRVHLLDSGWTSIEGRLVAARAMASQ